MARKGISRRQFIGSSVAGVAVTGIKGLRPGGTEMGGSELAGEEPNSELRTTKSLNGGWSFKRQGSPGAGIEPEFVGAERPDYADRAWKTVVVPHTWDATPDNPFCASDHFRGLGWYRREFEILAGWRGRRVWIEFKAVFQVADVYINGHHLGRHVGGFTGFGFDLTDHLELGGKNLLAVRVNDVLDPNIAPANETNVPGYGGIYRSVSLIAMHPLHVHRNGTWVTAEQSGGKTTVRIRTWVENQSSQTRSFNLKSLILEADGREIAGPDADENVGPNAAKQIDQSIAVTNPRLWSPDDPHLYQLVSIVSEGGRITDRYQTPFGIRFMGHDQAHGFTLNGKPIVLRGVDRRQDYGFLGDAVPEAIGVKDVRLMKDMGVNFVRTSHYPQDPAVIDACDRLGILVWEEVPNIKIHMYHAPLDEEENIYATRFPRGLMANIKHQLKEMVERDRNHPSIVMWGFADDLSSYQYPQDFVELSDYTHSLDPARWTAGRCAHVTDIIDATTIEDLVQAHKEHPEKKYIWNEWGSFHSERGREGPALVRKGRSVVFADSEAALACEGYLMQWNALPWLGTAKWCMFDTGEVNGTATRTLWEPQDGRITLRWPFNDYFGVADMWRLPKEAYFLFQSEWTDEPMAHIVGHWTWPESAGRNRKVKVYSNCDAVELFLNGESLGLRKPAAQERVWQDFRSLVDQFRDTEELGGQFTQQRFPGAYLKHPPFVWDEVTYQPGVLLAIGKKGNTTVRHQIHTAGRASSIMLKPDKASLVADGADVIFVEADVVDSAGTIVPAAQNWIAFSVTGPGRLLGGTTELDSITGIAAINVQSTGETGAVVIQATSPGLESASLRVPAGN
ncbi:MAG TPA: glycoside hydrolase family 2 TIM barrel-domain containing protein [Terriglobia bacterium]|nr:glycoside hydrolase family 2 TIM barrel-domain containing protein [Terriglobia bacterium]